MLLMELEKLSSSVLLLAKVGSDHGIALAVASYGITPKLLMGTKMAHTTFTLLLNLIHAETLLCSISKQSMIGQVLIVWDESNMVHKRCFEALSITLKDIREDSRMMGRVTVMLAGDFW